MIELWMAEPPVDGRTIKLGSGMARVVTWPSIRSRKIRGNPASWSPRWRRPAPVAYGAGVDAQRSYPDESERWYGGDPGYGGPEWDRRGGDDRYAPAGARYADEGYRVPEPRGSEPAYEPGPAERYAAEPGRPVGDLGRPPFDPGLPGDARTGQMPPVGPRSGEPLPPPMSPVPPTSPVPSMSPMPQRPNEALRRATGPVPPVGDGVYRTRRPAVAIVLGVLAAVFEVPALRLLLSGAFGDRVSGADVLAGTFLIIGLPIFAMGMYALVTGAGRLPVSAGDRPWLRPPLAYATVGLALFLAAAIAAA
jgi:hypothetical protein